MRIILIRHAESYDNLKQIVISSLNKGITDEGKKIANRLAKQLENSRITSIYSSPLRRCVETAYILSIHLGVPVIKHALLVERNLGKYDGLTISKLKEIRDKEGHQYLDVTQDWLGIDEVEQDHEIYERFKKILMVEPFDESAVNIFITHAGFIKAVLSELLLINQDRNCIIKIPYCCQTVLDFENGIWKLRGHVPIT